MSSKMSSWIPSFSQQEEDDTPPSETGQQQQLQQQYYQGSPSSPQPQPSSYRHNHQNLINLTNKTTLQPDHHKKSDTSGHQTQSAKNQIDQTHQHYQHHSDQTTENSSNTEPLEPSTSVLVRNHLINPKSTLNNTQGQLPNHHHHHHHHQPSIPPEPITINTSYLRDHQQLNQHSLIRSNSSCLIRPSNFNPINHHQHQISNSPIPNPVNRSTPSLKPHHATPSSHPQTSLISNPQLENIQSNLHHLHHSFSSSLILDHSTLLPPSRSRPSIGSDRLSSYPHSGMINDHHQSHPESNSAVPHSYHPHQNLSTNQPQLLQHQPSYHHLHHTLPHHHPLPSPSHFPPPIPHHHHHHHLIQNQSKLLPRRSSESVRVMPTQPRANPNNYDRSFSFTTNPSSATLRQSTQPSSSRSPIVYPALLSRVAEAFRNRINLSERTKDGLSYNECFDGREAVDKIAYIIKTTDRNLALLLGRALDSQKFFHDVTYDHRLRDSPNELYQFRRRLASAFSGSTPGTHQQQTVPSSIQPRTLRSQRPISHDSSEPYGDEDGAHEEEELEEDLEDEEEIALPCGVFTLLTDCYSPTCTRDRLCYSIACPRRLEQQARLNLKPKPGLNRKISTESLGDLKEPGTLWIHSVPQEVVDSVSDTEKKRQEAINECIYTERDFVRDLEYLRDVWIKPLQTTNIVAEHRRQDFVTQVFWNVLEVLSVNSRLCELLFKRQKSSHIVSKIGDIYLELVPHFSPFVKYGAHQLYGKYEFEKEKSSNPAFAKFVDETERLPESRKLELNAYLTKPTTRLARYPLLLEVVLKYTSEGHSDKTEIPKAVKMIRELLTKVNIETGKSENRFNLAQLDQQLVFRQGEAVDLRLREEGRELIYKGQLKKRGGSGSDSAELQVFLFDHAVLMVKHKQSSKSDNLKVYRKPIPLELLTITGILSPEDPSPGANKGSVPGRRSLMTRTSTGNKSGSSTNSGSPSGTNATNPASSKAGFPITWNHLGRKGYSIVLWAPTWQSRQKWLDKIEARQAEIRGRNTIFEMVSLNEGFFVGANKVTCATPYDNGNRLVFGTESGVYLGMALDSSRPPVRVIQVMNVTQVDLIEEHGILLVLADKAVMTFWLDQLDPNDAIGAAKRAKKISSNASFFRVGDCSGRKLVCVVKSGSVSSTIKTLEPVDNHGGVQTNPLRGRSRTSLRKIVPGNNEALKVYKEFYIPTESSSVHFLKSKLCIGCQKGFEIVDLETLDTQGLLDPADQSLEFIHRRESTVRPISIYRVEGEFLLCYEDFAFYVNKNGWRAKSGWIIQWEGHPTAFALHYPFVLAFEPSFIEVRHVESGSLAQIIPGPNIRHLFSESPPSTSAPILAAAARQGNYANRLPPIAGHGRPSTATSISAGLPSFRTQIIFAAESKILQLRLKATNQQQHLSLSSSSSSSTYFGSGTLPSPSAPFNQVQPHQHSHPQSYPQYASNHNHHQFLSHHPSAPTHPSLQQQQLHHTHPHQAPNHHQINPIISNQQYPLNQSSNSNSSDFSPSPYYIHHQ